KLQTCRHERSCRSRRGVVSSIFCKGAARRREATSEQADPLHFDGVLPMRRSALVLALVGMLWPGWACASETEGVKLSASALAARIDEHIAAGYRSHKAVPAPRAVDGELVRRLYLDLTGRIPDILAARDFADNSGKDKWTQLIDRLLANERYAIHFAKVWRAW